MKDRFSLLLLEEDEIFLQSVSATYYACGPDEEPSKTSAQVCAIVVLASLGCLSLSHALAQRGSLKICSESIVFDPEELRFPVVRVPLRAITRLGVCERASVPG